MDMFTLPFAHPAEFFISLAIGGGAALGQNWEQVKEWLKPLDTLLLIVGVPALLLLAAWRLGLLARLRARRG